ncbi:MAG: sulfotransferase [Actinomycetota bacterium]
MTGQAANRRGARARVRTRENGLAVRTGLPLHPDFQRLPAPLIVIGMHGSGTSVVSHILAELGVYMGANLDSHAEAGEFFQLNEELLYRSGAGWSRPEPFLADLSSASTTTSGVLRLLGATYGSLRTRYLAEMIRRPQSTRSVWGWKDPRTSLTLPLWLRLFPHARILHVRRDPATAAASIHRRALGEAQATSACDIGGSFATRARWMLLHPPAAARWIGRKAGWIPSPPTEDPCLDAGFCRNLAETYVAACRRHQDLGGARLEVRYEHLLEHPQDTVRMLAAFALGDVGEARIAAAAALVRRPRSAAPLPVA